MAAHETEKTWNASEPQNSVLITVSHLTYFQVQFLTLNLTRQGSPFFDFYSKMYFNQAKCDVFNPIQLSAAFQYPLNILQKLFSECSNAIQSSNGLFKS